MTFPIIISDAKFCHKVLTRSTKRMNFGIARDCPLLCLHLIPNVRRLVSKQFRRKYLQDGVTLEELDNATAKVFLM